MANSEKRVLPCSRRFLSAAILSFCVAACSITPAPPMPDPSKFFKANAQFNAHADKPPFTRVSCPNAAVPQFARKERIEGWAVAGVDIGPDGTVKKVNFHALSDPRFQEAARRCMEATRYHPAEHRGEPVVYLNYPVVMHFKLYMP